MAAAAAHGWRHRSWHGETICCHDAPLQPLSCRSSETKSISAQRSAILPLRMRQNVMPAKLNALSCGRDAAPRPLVRAAPDHARRNEIAIGNHGFRGRRQLAEDRMHRGRMRDHVVRAHRLTCGVIEEIGGDLRADRIGIVAVGHGVVVGANERLVGIENGTGHQGSLRKQAGLMPQADTRVPGKPGQSRLSVESSRSAKGAIRTSSEYCSAASVSFGRSRHVVRLIASSLETDVRSKSCLRCAGGIPHAAIARGSRRNRRSFLPLCARSAACCDKERDWQAQDWES